MFLGLPTILSTGQIFNTSSGHGLSDASNSCSLAGSSPNHFGQSFSAYAGRDLQTRSSDPELSRDRRSHRLHQCATAAIGALSEDRRKVLARTTSGNVTINGTLMHYAQDDLPFDGVGPVAWAPITGSKASAHSTTPKVSSIRAGGMQATSCERRSGGLPTGFSG